MCTNYYTSTRKKVADILLGAGVVALGYGLVEVVLRLGGNEWLALALYTLAAVGLFFAARRCGRRFAAVGILAVLMVPYLLLGACGIGTYEPRRQRVPAVPSSRAGNDTAAVDRVK